MWLLEVTALRHNSAARLLKAQHRGAATQVPTLAPIVDQVPNSVVSLSPLSPSSAHAVMVAVAVQHGIAKWAHCPRQQPSGELEPQSQKPLAPFEFGRMGQH